MTRYSDLDGLVPIEYSTTIRCPLYAVRTVGDYRGNKYINKWGKVHGNLLPKLNETFDSNNKHILLQNTHTLSKFTVMTGTDSSGVKYSLITANVNINDLHRDFVLQEIQQCDIRPILNPVFIKDDDKLIMSDCMFDYKEVKRPLLIRVGMMDMMVSEVL